MAGSRGIHLELTRAPGSRVFSHVKPSEIEIKKQALARKSFTFLRCTLEHERHSWHAHKRRPWYIFHYYFAPLVSCCEYRVRPLPDQLAQFSFENIHRKRLLKKNGCRVITFVFFLCFFTALFLVSFVAYVTAFFFHCALIVFIILLSFFSAFLFIFSDAWSNFRLDALFRVWWHSNREFTFGIHLFHFGKALFNI